MSDEKKARRPIAHADEDEVCRRVSAVCGDCAPDEVMLGWDGLTCVAIVTRSGSLHAREIHALTITGIHAGPDGWEIES